MLQSWRHIDSDAAEKNESGSHCSERGLKGHTGHQWRVQGDHSFVELVGEVGGQASSPLNSFLRSSEGRFLLTVLEVCEGRERSSPGGAGGNRSLLDDWGGVFSSLVALEVVMIDM